MRANCAEAFIRRAVNKPSNSRLNQCASAHRARFNRRVNGRAGQTIISDGCGCIAQSDDFGVRRRVAMRSGAVSGCRQKLAFARNDARADWDFVQLGGGKQRGVYRFAHPIRIIKLFVKIAVHSRRQCPPKGANCKYRFRRKQCQATVFCGKALFGCCCGCRI